MRNCVYEEELDALRAENTDVFTKKRFEIAEELLHELLHYFDTQIDAAIALLKRERVLRDDEDVEIFLTLLNENFAARNALRIIES